MKNSSEVKQLALVGMIWKLLEKVGMQGIQFVIQIVLARILLPEEYGLVGLLTIFITISDVFILQGFTTALIQKKECDEIDFSSVFYINIMMSLVLYILLYISAPSIAVFYNEEKLVNLMRVLSLNVVVGAFGAVHNAILLRRLEFKKSFLRNILNVLTQGVVGISMAVIGAGAWALVFSKVAGTLVGVISLCLTVKWKPVLKFSIQRVKKLFDYSSKILGTNLLNTLFNNIHSLIIGRYYTSADLGYYQRGQQIPQVVMTAIDGSINEVLYPTLSKFQDDLSALKMVLRRSMKTSMFIVLPIVTGLLATAEPITLILLTEKWLPSVPFMQLQCIICMFWPLSARTHALNAIGKSNITFKLSIISKVITLLLIFICVPFGMYAIMLGTIGASLISFWITTYAINKYIGYSVKEQLGDLVPTVAICFVMLLSVLGIGRFEFNLYIKLLIQIIVGVALYVIGAILSKNESFYYVLEILKKFLSKKRQ